MSEVKSSSVKAMFQSIKLAPVGMEGSAGSGPPAVTGSEEEEKRASTVTVISG